MSDNKNQNNDMSSASMRQAQEGLINLLSGGYYKELCKAQRAFYDEYLKLGFNEEQALRLTMMLGKT